MEEVYLDNSATTKVKDEVIDKMMEALTDNYANPSSRHSKGVEAEKLLKEARREVAKAIRAQEQEIIFTSGGTESNNLAIKGTVNALKRYGNHLITTKIEHSSTLHPMQDLEKEGWEVTFLDVDQEGVLDLEHLQEAISEDTILVSIMQVNNEVGSIQPIEEVAKIVKDYKDSGLYYHVDAVQALDKLEINVKDLRVDLLSMSGHKVHGPKGSGALYIADGTRLKSLITGGGQERGYRAGTENVAAQIGFAEAVRLATATREQDKVQMQKLKQRLAAGILEQIEGAELNGPQLAAAAPHILNFSFKGIKGEVLLNALSKEQIYVSTGSACSAKDDSGSHVLAAMGVEQEAMEGALRFSLSALNTVAQIDYTVDKLAEIVAKLKKFMA